MTAMADPSVQRAQSVPPTVSTRPLYVRQVPEPVWNLVHINAIRSRMRLQTYLVKILERSQPIVQPDDTDMAKHGAPSAQLESSDEVSLPESEHP